MIRRKCSIHRIINKIAARTITTKISLIPMMKQVKEEEQLQQQEEEGNTIATSSMYVDSSHRIQKL